MVFYKYATIQETDRCIFLFMDNQYEKPDMRKSSFTKQFLLTEKQDAINFAIFWATVKVSELYIDKKGRSKSVIIYIKDPEDKVRPMKSPVVS